MRQPGCMNDRPTRKAGPKLFPAPASWDFQKVQDSTDGSLLRVRHWRRRTWIPSGGRTVDGEAAGRSMLPLCI